MKNRAVKICLISLFLSAALTHSSYSEQIFEIVTHESVPPHIYQDNGKAIGIDIDIIKEIFKRLDIKYEIRHYPWIRAVKRVESGMSDMLFPAFKTEEREKFAVYPDTPIEIMRFSIFARKDRVFKYEKAEDLKGKTIGLVRGYSAGAVFDEAREKGYFKVEETNTVKSDIKKLIDGRIDCFINQYTVVRHYLKQAGLLDEIIEINNPDANKIPTYLVISRNSGIENIDELSEKIGNTLKKMWNDGTIEKIISNYLD